MKVTIMMATFQGEHFIRQQLDSIISQTFTDWELLIRDDLSTDTTVDILKIYAARDRRIILMGTEGEHGSAAINFSALFDLACMRKQSYLMFADQDDIWHPDKISSSVAFIQEKEFNEGKGFPVMIYSAFQYIDVNGRKIDQELNIPEKLDFKVLLNENHAYGCTMILNRALVDKVVHIPHSVENHDYWVSLVACAFGKAIFNPEKLIDYRQHNNNVSGNVEKRNLSSRLHRYVENKDFMFPVLSKNFKMIGLFYNTYLSSLKEKDSTLVSGYLYAFRKGTLSLIFFMIRNGMHKVGFMQTLAHYYVLIQLRNKIVEHG
ncbi:glycosyltransferase [Pedobacter sp. AW31-3R]|uniref:glycosyltransferase n=1 Tax=Pedobacter sp. AW31-3R TaxID=3445781 RepID=UPI003F9FAA6F